MKKKQMNRYESRVITTNVTKISNAQQAIDLKSVPEGLTFNDYKNYFSRALNNLSDALFIFQDWKKSVLIENDAVNVYIDNDTLLFMTNEEN